MATDDQSSPPPVRASEQDWKRIADSWAWSPSLCLLELRDRVAALEAAGRVTGDPANAPSVPAGGWSGVAVDCLPPISPAVWVGTPADVAPQVVPTIPAVLTVDELADCLPANAWAGPEGCSRQAFARHLLDHPRIGRLLRGEGAAAPVRVVLPKHQPYPSFYGGGEWYEDGWDSAWAAARAEVERQQQGGQADG